MQLIYFWPYSLGGGSDAASGYQTTVATCYCFRHYIDRDGTDGATVQQHESQPSSDEDSQGRTSRPGRTSQMVIDYCLSLHACHQVDLLSVWACLLWHLFIEQLLFCFCWQTWTSTSKVKFDFRTTEFLEDFAKVGQNVYVYNVSVKAELTASNLKICPLNTFLVWWSLSSLERLASYCFIFKHFIKPLWC